MKKYKLVEVYKYYGFFGFIRMLRDIFISKIVIDRKIRIIRYPFYIRGGRNIDFKKGFSSGVGLRLDACSGGVIQFGTNVGVGDYVHIAAVSKLKIGDNTLIASKVYITDHDHGSYSGEIQSSPFEIQNSKILNSKQTIIGDNVWIGEMVSILKGVKIGENSIIAAGSIVVNDIPDNCIAGGNPAKPLKIWDEKVLKWVRCE